MARLPNPDPDNLTPEQQRVYNDITSGPRGSLRGPLKIWLHRPELLDKAQALGQFCRFDSSLPPRLSELAILVTARIWDATFEWQAHVPFAQKGGLEQSIIDALEQDLQPEFSKEDEEVVYEVSRRLNLDRKISDELYRKAERILGRDGLIDLITVLGYYSLVSMTINAFEIDPMKT
ncbi:MAG: carboxymuconolactone decarboxylase family protein [Gammaproteobacteria bacterium]|nr:carboxymuconolactone decarboxylase family protein [Gammaproteobacteria bacterium]